MPCEQDSERWMRSCNRGYFLNNEHMRMMWYSAFKTGENAAYRCFVNPFSRYL